MSNTLNKPNYFWLEPTEDSILHLEESKEDGYYVPDFYISTDKDTWIHIGDDNNNISFPANTKVYFKREITDELTDYIRGGADFYQNLGFYTMDSENQLVPSPFKCGGDIGSIINGVGNFQDKVPNLAFKYLFTGAILLNAPELPFTKVGDNAYKYMFSDCHLKNAPELPATELGDFCYQGMFAGCDLINAPLVLPATNSSVGCYEEMFLLCPNLKKAPIIELENTSNVCCWEMFWGCTSLIIAPILKPTALAESCYEYMFGNCPNLKSITCLATSWTDTPWGEPSTNEWLDEGSPTGTFYKAKNVDWITGTSGIPEGWTIKTYIPPKPIRITYDIVKDIYTVLGGTKYCPTNYDLAQNILSIIEDAEITNYTGQTPKAIDINLYINGDDRYYTFSDTLTSGDFLEGNIKINGVIPAGNYKGFVTGNEVSAILTGSNYNCQAVALKKEGEQYVSK